MLWRILIAIAIIGIALALAASPVMLGKAFGAECTIELKHRSNSGAEEVEGKAVWFTEKGVWLFDRIPTSQTLLQGLDKGTWIMDGSGAKAVGIIGFYPYFSIQKIERNCR